MYTSPDLGNLCGAMLCFFGTPKIILKTPLVVGLPKTSSSVQSVKEVHCSNSIACNSGVLSVEEVIYS